MIPYQFNRNQPTYQRAMPPTRETVTPPQASLKMLPEGVIQKLNKYVNYWKTKL